MHGDIFFGVTNGFASRVVYVLVTTVSMYLHAVENPTCNVKPY